MIRALVLLLAVATTACSGSSSPEPSAGGGTFPVSTALDGNAGDTSAPSTLAPAGPTCWTGEASSGGGIVFGDVTETLGLIAPFTGMHGHAAIWTDSNGDDQPDLYVGTFADRENEIYQERGASGPSPDRLTLGSSDGYQADTSLPEAFTRSAGGITADLDDDGDLDLVVSRNIKDSALGLTPTMVLENTGGVYTEVAGSGLPVEFGGRAVGALDFDGDGLMDLFIAEDRFTGGSSRLFHNQGGLVFTDVTFEQGIPGDVHGLGVATSDLDGDRLIDIFVAGSNRLFFGEEDGGFTEGDSAVFEWEVYGAEDDVSGVSVSDVNRDGLVDVALGHHYNSTLEFDEMVPVRLYLNEGDRSFRDVTEESGLTPLPTKAPHVELNDYDNDGLVDLLTSASADAGPAIFRNSGLEGGVPRFDEPAGLGDAQYWVAAPSVDFDRDGLLDVFLLEWEPALPSLLLHNQGGEGNWLEVSVDAAHDFGIGWRVEVRQGDALMGARDITVTQGYSAGVLPRAHFGVGETSEVDLRLIPPNGAEPVDLAAVPVNQHLRWPEGCG